MHSSLNELSVYLFLQRLQYKMSPSLNQIYLILSTCLIQISCGLQPACPQMFQRTFEGYIPKGNMTAGAGTYSLISTATDLEQCIKQCCKNKTCNAAVMYNEQCYAVDCQSNEACLPILHHNTNLRDNLTMVLVNPELESDNWKDILKSHEHKQPTNWRNFCPKLHESTYRGYLPFGNTSAGNYSYIAKVNDLKNCTLDCCHNDNCNVAIMIADKCYHIECKSSRLCVPMLYHNETLRKSFYMVLVKPLERRHTWKDILKNFNASDDEKQEFLPEVSSREQTTLPPSFTTKNYETNDKLTLRLPKSNNLRVEWQQIEGPTKLEFQEKDKFLFDIEKLIPGNYTIKLGVRKEETHKNDKKIEITEKSNRIEATTNTVTVIHVQNNTTKI